MYKPRHFGWKLMHVSGILANLGLTTAAAISYIHNLVSVTGPVEWNSMDQAVLSVNSMDPCRFALISGLGRWNPSDAAVRTLLVTCLVVVSSSASSPQGLTQVLICFRLSAGFSRGSAQYRHLPFALVCRGPPDHPDRGRAALAQSDRHLLRLRPQSGHGRCRRWTCRHIGHQDGRVQVADCAYSVGIDSSVRPPTPAVLGSIGLTIPLDPQTT